MIYHLFTVKTLIAWGVPAFVVALVVFPLADAIFGGDDEDRKSQLEGGAFGDEFALEDEQPQPPGLPFGRKKPRRAPNRPKAPQYLKVERLNERLESFEFSLESASSGRYAARKARRNRRLGKAFGDELDWRGLSDDEFGFNVSRRRRPDAYAIDATPRAALDAVADAERDYLKKSLLKPGRTCSSRGRRSGPRGGDERDVGRERDSSHRRKRSGGQGQEAHALRRLPEVEPRRRVERS